MPPVELIAGRSRRPWHLARVRVERSRHEHMLHLESGQREGSGLGRSAVEAVEVDRDEVERGVALLLELQLAPRSGLESRRPAGSPL